MNFDPLEFYLLTCIEKSFTWSCSQCKLWSWRGNNMESQVSMISGPGKWEASLFSFCRPIGSLSLLSSNIRYLPGPRGQGRSPSPMWAGPGSQTGAPHVSGDWARLRTFNNVVPGVMALSHQWWGCGMSSCCYNNNYTGSDHYSCALTPVCQIITRVTRHWCGD